MAEKWNMIGILSSEITIWSLNLGFGFEPWDLGFVNKRSEILK